MQQQRTIAFIKALTPMRWALIALFTLLAIFELFNGAFYGSLDIGFVVAPILLVLLINQYYLSFKNGSLQRSSTPNFLYEEGKLRRAWAFTKFIFKSIKYEVLAEAPKLSRRERATKILMNNIFILMFALAILGGVFHGVSETFKLLAIFAWSLAFLALNVSEFIRTLSYFRLLLANIGLVFVLGSFTLIVM